MATDHRMVLTEEQSKAMEEVYLSGFTSGAASLGLVQGASVDLASSFAKAMCDSLSEDPVAMADVWTTINACLNDEDLDDSPIREVRNVHHRS